MFFFIQCRELGTFGKTKSEMNVMMPSIAIRMTDFLKVLGDDGVNVITANELRKKIGIKNYNTNAQRFQVDCIVTNCWSTIVPRKLLDPEKLTIIDAGKCSRCICV